MNLAAERKGTDESRMESSSTRGGNPSNDAAINNPLVALHLCGLGLPQLLLRLLQIYCLPVPETNLLRTSERPDNACRRWD